MSERKEIARNERAARICGLRGPGQPFQEPWEMGYSCPICSIQITKENMFDKDGNVAHEFDKLHFSEYNGFMWCEKCNIDIPSFFCIPRPMTKDSITNDMELYLNFLTEVQNRVNPKSEKILNVKRANEELEKYKRLAKSHWIGFVDSCKVITQENGEPIEQ